MGLSMSSLVFRCSEHSACDDILRRIREITDDYEGLVHNFDQPSSAYAIVSPYGDLAPVLGELAEDISAMSEDYVIMTGCVDSDFAILEVFLRGELVERCCIGEIYEEMEEIFGVTKPRRELWQKLLPEGTDPEALEEVLYGESLFVEDQLRKLSALTGLPIMDDGLVFSGEEDA